jgi:DNA helicase-2/ATP-dependent DNA helicase PcrA
MAELFAAQADTTETAAALFLTEREAKEAYGQLCALFAEKGLSRELLSYVDRNSSHFSTGLTVTTYYLAKGLEFETVYGVTPRDRRDTLVTQARFIMATRAMHRLYVWEDTGEN